MGILNATPDSFSDGGKFLSTRKAVNRIEQMIMEGAEIIDVGGESTRPGSDPVTEQQEMDRVLPVLEIACKKFKETIFSIDTTKYQVAEEALKAGVHVVNDVSGLQKEPRLADLCSKYKAGYILMHSKGNPKTMQINPVYDDVMEEITQFFKNGISKLNKAGVDSVILDPGIGFGKTLEHNLQIIIGLRKFSLLGMPVLVGASRKSMIGQLLDNRPAEDRLAGTIAVQYHSLLQGAKILRVHDVQEAVDSVRIFEAVTGRQN